MHDYPPEPGGVAFGRRCGFQPGGGCLRGRTEAGGETDLKGRGFRGKITGCGQFPGWCGFAGQGLNLGYKLHVHFRIRPACRKTRRRQVLAVVLFKPGQGTVAGALPLALIIHPGEAGHDQALPGPGHRHVEDPPGLIHHPPIFQIPQEQIEGTLLFLDIGPGQGQAVEVLAGDFFQEEWGGVVFALQGLPVQEGEKHLVKLQPLGPVDRQDFHRRGLGLGVRGLKSRLQVKVGLDEGGFGEPVIRRGQKVQVGPGVGYSPGSFPGGDPGPGGGGLKEAGQDVGERPPSHLTSGLIKRLGQSR